MRTEQEILGRFHEMRFRKLKEFKEERLSRCHENCSYNEKVKAGKVGKVGLCSNAEVLTKREGPFICNDDDISRSCVCFSCKSTEEEVERDFDDILRSPPKCGEKYPKLAILIWFLQKDQEEESRFSRLKCHIKKIVSETMRVVLLKWL